MTMNTLVAIVLFLVGPIVGLNYPNHNDASSVTWAHAVNTRSKLLEAMESNVDFLEADIVYGIVTGETPSKIQLIMAHPPDNSSQLSLEAWLKAVLSSDKPQGVKLDFKDITTVKESLRLIHDKNFTKHPITSNLWLNADIQPGPVDAPGLPVDAKQFLELCVEYFPRSTLSLGWTTYLNTSITGRRQYLWSHVLEMAKLLKSMGVYQPVTFPVRAAFVGQSIAPLRWLLDVIPRSSLTVWSSLNDVANVSALIDLRVSVPKSRVYYDLIPKSFSDDFAAARKDLSVMRRKPLEHLTCDGQSRTANWLVENPKCAYPGSQSVAFIDACHVVYREDDERKTPQELDVVFEFLDGQSDDAFVITFITEPVLKVRLTAGGSVQFGNKNEELELSDQSLEPGRCYRVKIHEPGPGKSSKLSVCTVDCETKQPLQRGVHLRLEPIGRKAPNRNVIGFESVGRGAKVIQELRLTCSPHANIGSGFTVIIIHYLVWLMALYTFITIF